jgi:thiamine-monophosphate kinase
MTAMIGPFRAAAIDALLRAKDPAAAAATMLAGLSPPAEEAAGEAAERALVRGILERMGRPAILALGPGDDAVVLRTPGAQVAAATDLTVEGVHYRKGGTGKAAGFKAAARALSDLAAVGARPVGLMVGVALRGRNVRWKAARVQAGIDRAAATWGAPILGGDTKETPGTEVISVTALGVVEGPPALPRSGGRPGDALFVTGPLGGSIHGRHLRPRPRIGVGLALRQGGLAGACIDISDGLATDLHRLCRASGAGALLESWRVPIHPDARRGGERDPLSRALFDGEDYELLFAVPPEEAARVASEGVAKRRVHRVGRLVHPAAGVVVQGEDGLVHPLPDAGWSHFRRGRP